MEHSSNVHTIASIVGLPTVGHGGRVAHRGHTVRKVRAALAAGATPDEILPMIPWGSHGSAFVVDVRLYGPASYSTRRVRALIDGRSRVVVAVVCGDGHAFAFATGRWAFALERVFSRGFSARALDALAARRARAQRVLAAPFARRESLRQRLLAEDREVLAAERAARKEDEILGAAAVRAWARQWHAAQDAAGFEIGADGAEPVPVGSTRYFDGPHGGAVILNDGIRRGAGRALGSTGRSKAITAVEVKAAEIRAGRRAERWEWLAETVRVR